MLIKCPWLMAFLTSVAAPLYAQAAAPQCIAVVGTNDVHGVLEPLTITVDNASVRSGGIVGLSAYVRNLRTVYGKRMILLDGGDLFQGTLASNLAGGKPVIEAYNLLGYSGSAIGNHEFDFGAIDNGTDRMGVLKARIAEAQFPFFSLNVFDRSTGKRITWANTQASVLRDVGGIRVGILGVSTPETPKVTRPQNVATLEFRDPAPLVLEEARSLRKQWADLVVFVGHIGGRCTKLDNPNNLSTCDRDPRSAELLELLQTLPPGTIDVAVGGHTHQFMAHWINGTATIESGARAQHLGWVEACLGANGRFDRTASTIHAATELCLDTWIDGTCRRRKTATAVSPATFLGAKVVPVPEVQAALKPYEDAVAEVAKKPVGVALAQPMNAVTLTGVVAESMRRSMRADFGMQNRGGIRAELPAGQVTYGEIFGVLPFDNSVARVKMTGQQVSDLYALMARYRPGSGPTFVGVAPCKDPLQTSVCTSKGAPLDPNASYTLATSDFLLEGGDGADAVFSKVPEPDRQVSDILMRDALIELLAAMYPSRT